MTVQDCKNKTTSMEFVCWRQRMEDEINDFHREDYFLANLARCIIQAAGDGKKEVPMKPFLLKFTNESEKAVTESELEKKMAHSKSCWGQLVGINLMPTYDLVSQPDEVN